MNEQIPHTETISQKTVRRLKEFTEKLEAGVPIEAVQVTRTETPDGPMHTRKPIVIDTLSEPTFPSDRGDWTLENIQRLFRMGTNWKLHKLVLKTGIDKDVLLDQVLVRRNGFAAGNDDEGEEEWRFNPCLMDVERAKEVQ